MSLRVLPAVLVGAVCLLLAGSTLAFTVAIDHRVFLGELMAFAAMSAFIAHLTTRLTPSLDGGNRSFSGLVLRFWWKILTFLPQAGSAPAYRWRAGCSIDIFRRQFMTINAVSLGQIPSNQSVPSQQILPGGNSLKMIRAHAIGIATALRTNVIDPKPFWDGADTDDIGKTMGKNRSSGLGVDEDSIPLRSDLSLPVPTRLGFLNLVPEPGHQALSDLHEAKILEVCW